MYKNYFDHEKLNTNILPKYEYLPESNWLSFTSKDVGNTNGQCPLLTHQDLEGGPQSVHCQWHPCNGIGIPWELVKTRGDWSQSCLRLGPGRHGWGPSFFECSVPGFDQLLRFSVLSWEGGPVLLHQNLRASIYCRFLGLTQAW